MHVAPLHVDARRTKMHINAGPLTIPIESPKTSVALPDLSQVLGLFKDLSSAELAVHAMIPPRNESKDAVGLCMPIGLPCLEFARSLAGTRGKAQNLARE